MSQVHGKAAGVMDWECRQSQYTRTTFSFRIADVRKVGPESRHLTEIEVNTENIERSTGQSGFFFMNKSFNTIFLLANQV